MKIKNTYKLTKWPLRLSSKFLTLGLPLILILFTTRIWFSSPIMKWEYKRPSMPKDIYGFTTNDRIKYGTRVLEYILDNSKDISYLRNMTFLNGKPMFNARELKHEEDVKKVVKLITKVSYFFIFIYVFLFLLFLINRGTRRLLLRSVFWGGVFSFLIILIGSLVSLFAFEAFFELFHKFLGFEGDSWLFKSSDALIRLFPLKFWLDMFMIIFAGVLLESFILIILAWFYGRKG